MTTDTASNPTTPLRASTGLVGPMASLWCADCGAPATHEVLPRIPWKWHATSHGMRLTCEMGARALDPEHRRRLTLADFAA